MNNELHNLIRENGYNAALLDVLERVIDKIDYQTRREILTMWKDGDIKPSVATPAAANQAVLSVTIHDRVTV